MSALQAFVPMFEPRSIAVIGASATSASAGNRYIRHLKNFGFLGGVYPIHPTALEVEGLPAFASVEAVPVEIDYAYVAVAAPMVPEVVRSFAGRVRIAQVMSSGFAETAAGSALEQELARAAREAGVRVVGPNCLGVYSPRGRVTFTERASAEPGSLGVVCQSGGLGIDIIRRGQNRGLRFSGLVTVGNCADVQPWEVVEYFLECPHTKVIGLYLEQAADGRKLFEILRNGRSRKPVVLLKGGRTAQGRRAAISHTGALAGGDEGWNALAVQTGTVLTEHLDAYLDALHALQCLAPRAQPTQRVVLFGNGGGTSVLGTDAFARAGFDVPPLEHGTVADLQMLKLPAGSSVANPIDVPAGALQQDQGRAAQRIMEVLCATPGIEAVVMHVNMTVVLSFRHVDMLGNLIEAALKARANSAAGMHLLLVLRSDGDADVEEQKRISRQRAIRAGIPVFDELVAAASALRGVQHVERYRARCRSV